jgi:hypothetical protein
MLACWQYAVDVCLLCCCCCCIIAGPPVLICFGPSVHPEMKHVSCLGTSMPPNYSRNNCCPSTQPITHTTRVTARADVQSFELYCYITK